MNKKGFTLVEIVVTVALLSVFAVLIGDFQAKVFIFNRIFQSGNYVGTDAQNVVKSMASEIRSMSPSSAGAYAIDEAGTSTLSFYNDIDDDGLKEKIRYFISGTTLKRGIIKPSINPIVYNSASETTSVLMSNIRNTSATPIFMYYDTNYTGGATSSLDLPINIVKVRLININVVLDADPSSPLVPLYATTQISIRNLKDNL